MNETLYLLIEMERQKQRKKLKNFARRLLDVYRMTISDTNDLVLLVIVFLLVSQVAEEFYLP